MANRNGTAESPAEDGKAALQLPPMQVFGRSGQEVTLAGNKYKLRVFTTSGILEVCDFINESDMQSMVVDSGLPGDMLAEGAIAARQTDKLQALLSMVLVEEIPENLVLAALPEEIGACLNLLFKMSGLTWLAAVIKNFGLLRTQQMARAMLGPSAPSVAPSGTGQS